MILLSGVPILTMDDVREMQRHQHHQIRCRSHRSKVAWKRLRRAWNNEVGWVPGDPIAWDAPVLPAISMPCDLCKLGLHVHKTRGTTSV